MTRPHVPVLAGELIDALDPQPGEVAVDCTFGAGGHARLVANRIGPTGLLVCIDRDPAAEERFEELAAEVPCQTRFLRVDYADGLPALAAEGIARGHGVPRPRRVVDADRRLGARLLLLLRRAARHAHGPGAGARRARGRERAGTSAGWRARSSATARSATRGRSPARSSSVARAQPFETTGELAETIKSAVPAPARFGGGHPAKRVFQAIRIVGQRRARLARPRAAGGLGAAAARRPPGGGVVPFARGPPRQAVPRRPRARLHLPARPADLRVRAHARGRAPHPPARSCPAQPRSPRTRARGPASSARPASWRRVPSGAGRHRRAAVTRAEPRTAAHGAASQPGTRAAAPAPRARRRGARRSYSRRDGARRPRRGIAAIPRSPFVDRLLTGRVWIVLLGGPARRDRHRERRAARDERGHRADDREGDRAEAGELAPAAAGCAARLERADPARRRRPRPGAAGAGRGALPRRAAGRGSARWR